MPLTQKGEEIKSALTKEYGEKKGEQVLYAGKNKGTFTGIDAEPYAKVLENARAAQREYSEAQKKYRARDIGDKEFLAAKKKYEKSEEEFSKARGEHPSQHKLDSDTLDRIADCADRLSARLDAMVDGDKPWPHEHEYPEWLKKSLAKPIVNSGKMNREMKTKAWQKRNLPDG